MRQITKHGKSRVNSIQYFQRYSGYKVYGIEMESEVRKDYVHYQMRRGHAVQTSRTGLVIYVDNPWLAVSDQNSYSQLGLVEYKNPYLARIMTGRSLPKAFV